MAERIRTRYDITVLPFSQARDSLRANGLETYESCADISCASLQGVTLGATHAIVGKLSRADEAYRVSLALIDIRRRRELSRCEREFSGNFQTVVSVGVDEIISALWYGKGLAGANPLIIREVISNKRKERARFMVGLSAGAAVVAAAAITYFTVTRQVDEPSRTTTDITVEW
jgi:hypothetical protein